MTNHQHGSGDDVVIIGVGMTPVGEHWYTFIRELALQAIMMVRGGLAALLPDALYFSNMLAPALSSQTLPWSWLPAFSGLTCL